MKVKSRGRSERYFFFFLVGQGESDKRERVSESVHHYVRRFLGFVLPPPPPSDDFRIIGSNGLSRGGGGILILESNLESEFGGRGSKGT
jgi:hypothetical protein